MISTRFSRLNVLTLGGLLTLALAGPAQVFGRANADAALERAIGRVMPALVRIFVLSDEAGGGRMEKLVSAGSGAVISEDGYIITNHHVAGKARHLICRMADGEEIEAKLVGTDALADIAVIKLDLSQRTKGAKLSVAKFGNSDVLRVGDTVLAMGSPMAVSQSVTKGIVANTSLMMPNVFGPSSGFRLDGESVGSLVRWIGHDAVIYGGNSGGPLVNLDGVIIGINEVGLASLGGAIPANLAKSVAEQLIKQGHVDRSWTGLELQERPKSFPVSHGALVGGVIAGSPAGHAGLQPGDVLTEFDGVAVNAAIQEDLPPVNAVVLGTPIGKCVAVKVIRDGEEQKFQLTTTTRGKAVNRDSEFKDWGMTGRNFTMLSAIEHKRPSTDGVQVTSLDPAGPAAAAVPPLEHGDVIVSVANKPVKNEAELRHITADLLKGKTDPSPVLVTYERGVSQFLTVAKLPARETPPEENPLKPGLQMLLQPVGMELAEALGIKSGVRVSFVFPNRAAAKAGLQTGDILTKFDGDVIRCQQPEDVGQFLARVRRYKVGREVDIDFLRGTDKTPQKAKITLETDGPPVNELKRYKDRVFELTVREMTEMERVTQQIPSDVQGVRIDEVMTAGWASLAHVQVGDILLAVGGQPTPDVATAEKLLKALAKKKPHRFVLFVRRGVHSLFAELEPNWESITTAAAEAN
jgi:serine protease Do